MIHTTYTAHPLAAAFPRPTAQEYQALKESIDHNGQREPITLYQGMVLDGLSRLQACEELGLRPSTKNYNPEEDGADPQAYVIDANINRRHLTVSQRAVIALGLLEQRVPEHSPALPGMQPVASTRARTQVEAAEEVKISERSVNKAVAIAKENPEGVEEMAAGKKSLTQIAKETRAARVAKFAGDREALITPAFREESSKALVAAIEGGKILRSALQLSGWQALSAKERTRLEPLALADLPMDVIDGFEEMDLSPSSPILFLLLRALVSKNLGAECIFRDGPSAEHGMCYRVRVEAYAEPKTPSPKAKPK